MHLLQELLLISEDLGNLKQIDGQFLALLMGEGHMYKKKTLTDKFGKDSKVETVSIKTYAEFMSHFTNQNTRMGMDIRTAIILRLDGRQVLGVTTITTEEKKYKYETSYKVIADVSLFGYKEGTVGHNIDALIQHKEYITKMGIKVALEDTPFDYEKITRLSTISKAKIEALVKMIIEAAKKSGIKSIEAMVISGDDNRTKINSERKTARLGSAPIRTGNYVGGMHSGAWIKAQIKLLRTDFEARVARHKSSKAPEYGNDPVEIIKNAIEKGYLARIKFGGFTYTIGRRSNIDVASLLDKNARSNENYITYELDENSTEFRKLKEKVKELEPEYDKIKVPYPSTKDDDELDAYRVKRREVKDKFFKEHGIDFMPRKEIKLIMGLDGGKILPVDVKLGEEPYYLNY
jgi:hypothetical protein